VLLLAADPQFPAQTGDTVMAHCKSLPVECGIKSPQSYSVGSRQ
jgi:hypothetical protein